MSGAVRVERPAPRSTMLPFQEPRTDAVRRETLAGCEAGPLYFAQVREDPALEIAALAPTRRDTVVCVSSGGCTALSLLAAGAGRVHAVDLNPTQNHVVELKAVAVERLSVAAAAAFLGGRPAWEERLTIYRALRGALSPAARAWWDERPRLVRRGVIRAGVSERFIGAVVLAMRAIVHPKSRVSRLLACRTLEEQRDFYDREWNTRRWRAMYAALLNRWVFDRAYDPRFFAHVRNPSFAAHFLRLAEHALTELPVRDNYFLHQMLTGHYPEDAQARPPYLSATGAPVVAESLDRLTLVDGDYAEWLRRLTPRSVDGFALSNICEWLTAEQTDALFREIVRTAAPGARLCFRNFVGWTELPAWCAAHFVEDRRLGAALSARDRSVVQPRIVVCRQRAGVRA
ncbi:MAG TPA: DUF3419 family protein [Gemmatimonadaceae bacterium]|nr:DUF3419 family protein [Gemmatimonadaceae bacterium]